MFSSGTQLIHLWWSFEFETKYLKVCFFSGVVYSIFRGNSTEILMDFHFVKFIFNSVYN